MKMSSFLRSAVKVLTLSISFCLTSVYAVDEQGQRIHTPTEVTRHLNEEVAASAEILSIAEINQIQELFVNETLKVMNSVWAETAVGGLDKWRGLIYAMVCKQDLQLIHLFKVKYDSWPLFYEQMKQRHQGSGLTSTQLGSITYRDLSYANYIAYVDSFIYAQFALYGRFSVEHPQVVEDICKTPQLEPDMNIIESMDRNYQFNVGLTIDQLGHELRNQYQLIYLVGRSATMGFIKSSLPRMPLLSAFAMSEVMDEYDSTQSLFDALMETYPIFGSDGFVETMAETWNKMDNVEVDYQAIDPNIIGFIWHVQRQGFQSGFHSVLRKLKKSHPEVHQQVQVKFKEEFMPQFLGSRQVNNVH